MSTTKCFKCGTDISNTDNFCTECGAARIAFEENYCINSECERYLNSDLVKPEQKYCGKCGMPTAYGNNLMKLL